MAYIPTDLKRINKIKGIYFTVLKSPYRVGYKSFKKRITDREYTDFCIYLSSIFVDLLVDTINKQKYAHTKWPSLSIPYLQYKKKKHLSLNIWEATGLLKRSIKMYREGEFLNIGFKDSDRYPKTNAKVNTVARYVEYGVPNRMPPRPLFRTVLNLVRRNIQRYYNKYRQRLKKSRKDFLFLTKNTKERKVQKRLVIKKTYGRKSRYGRR